MHDVFYFTDIHGRWNLYKTLMNYCIEQDPNCTIIFGGDACDRGPDGYKIMKHLLADRQTIYLMGNHEDLFINSCDAIIGYHAKNDELYSKLHSYSRKEAENFLKTSFNPDILLSKSNGGLDTLTDWLADGANEDFVDSIRKLPCTFSWENFDFCHAGSTYNEFKKVAEAEYNGTPVNYVSKNILIWDRNAIPLGWETGRICVHGHTPATFLPAKAYGSSEKIINTIHPACWGDLMGAKDKRGGKKIDMDTGATFTGRAYVLNVRTANAICFYDPTVVGMEGEIKIIEQYKLNLD